MDGFSIQNLLPNCYIDFHLLWYVRTTCGLFRLISSFRFEDLGADEKQKLCSELHELEVSQLFQLQKQLFVLDKDYMKLYTWWNLTAFLDITPKSQVI